MNAGGERCTVATIVVGLDAIGGYARGAIEMDRDEDGIAVRVRDRHPRSQGNEDVVLPRHDHPVTVSLENALQALRHIEGLVFFADALSRHATAIIAAVAGVDHDGARLPVGGGTKSKEASEC